MGFKEDLEAILNTTPEEKQTLMFSATVPKTIANLQKIIKKMLLELLLVNLMHNMLILNIKHSKLYQVIKKMLLLILFDIMKLQIL